MDVRGELERLRELEFREFTLRLMPGVDPESVLGVRLPHLRKLAKKLAKEDWRTYLAEASDKTYEEVMLQGMVIGCAKAGLREKLDCVKTFVPKIDNWSVCDSFCAGLKLPREYPEEMWEFLLPYLQSEKTYEIRFAIVMMLDYYIDSVHIDQVLRLLDDIRSQEYYVQMAVAWALSMCYARFPEKTEQYLDNCRLDDFTYNKTLQKILESRQIDAITKQKIREKKR